MSEFERLLSVYCDDPSGNTWRFVTGSIVTGACAMSPPVLHPTMMGVLRAVHVAEHHVVRHGDPQRERGGGQGRRVSVRVRDERALR